MVEQSEPERAVASRPQRPAMERPPGPVSLSQVRPGTVSRGVSLLRTGIAVGGIAIVTAFIWRSDTTTALVASLENSGATEAVRQEAANIVLFGSLGLMLLLMVLELLFTGGVGRGGRVARMALSVLIPVHVAVLYVLHEAVVQETWYGTVILICLLAQSLLSLLALVYLWLPTSSRWLREVRRGPVRIRPDSEG